MVFIHSYKNNNSVGGIMTNNINGIDVSECPCKDYDKCLEAPILNEYCDLIDYQDCEPQTLCPYRSKTKILNGC